MVVFIERTKMRTDLLLCDCSSPEHQMIIRYDDEDKMVFVSIILSGVSLKERIIRGIRYIFGRECVYGHFQELILTKEHIPQLEKVIEHLK